MTAGFSRSLVAASFLLLTAAVPALAAPPTDKGPGAAPKLERRVPPTREERLARLFDRLGKAKSADEAKLLQDAIQTIWLRSGSDTVDLLMARAQTLQRGDADAAVVLLDKVVSMRPDYVEGWNQRAMIFFQKKDYQHALLDIRETLQREPRHYGAWLGLARILEEFDMDKKALAAYRKVLALNPNAEGVQKSVDKLAEEIEGRDL
jgi:tetratricopeptide (TPR) repeat protein